MAVDRGRDANVTDAPFAKTAAGFHPDCHRDCMPQTLWKWRNIPAFPDPQIPNLINNREKVPGTGFRQNNCACASRRTDAAAMGLAITVPTADFRAVPSSGHRKGTRGHGSAASRAWRRPQHWKMVKSLQRNGNR